MLSRPLLTNVFKGRVIDTPAFVERKVHYATSNRPFIRGVR
jgi:hypothetical protein